MADNKSIAIILGATIGVAAVATAIGVYAWRHSEPDVKDVNEIFDRARRTVEDLGKALEVLRKPVEQAS